MPNSEGRVVLLPNLLDEEAAAEMFLPPSVSKAVSALDGLIAESEKSARRYLRRFLSHEQMARLPLKLLNEHTPLSALDELLDPVAKGQIWGVMSDAGLPCLADPGAPLVLRARERNLRVEALTGPSSVILALQLSGLSGQRFAFHGYLPRETPALQEALRRLEKRSAEEGSTQIWIEAPYRSQKMMVACLETLQLSTLLCAALSLTTPKERIATRTVAAWKRASFSCEKEPGVFLLHSRT